MMSGWYYKHDGRTQGPVTLPGLQHLADPEDLIWPVGKDPRTAIQAQLAVIFRSRAEPTRLPKTVVYPRESPTTVAGGKQADTAPALEKPGSTVPDWLADILAAERRPQQPAAPEASTAPDWVEDVRQAEESPPANTTSGGSGTSTPPGQ